MTEPQRPAAGEFNPYYQKYIDLVPDDDVRSLLRVQLSDTLALLRPLNEQQASHRYGPGKWSIKEVVGHMIDTERVFCYRAMRFARADQTELPGFDENAFVAGAEFDQRSLESLLRELEAVRGATAAFFHGLPQQAWTRAGTANNNRMSVRAAAYVIAGHELHHRDILQTRYLAAPAASA